MALTTEDLQAIRALMREEIQAETAPIKAGQHAMQADISIIKEDIAEIKEEAKITRNTANLLLSWAEKADRTTVNVGLYDDK